MAQPLDRVQHALQLRQPARHVLLAEVGARDDDLQGEGDRQSDDEGAVPSPQGEGEEEQAGKGFSPLPFGREAGGGDGI